MGIIEEIRRRDEVHMVRAVWEWFICGEVYERSCTVRGDGGYGALSKSQSKLDPENYQNVR